MKRRIVLDTETTGLHPHTGDRVVEIGAVELIDNIKTGKTYHIYLNPQRNMPQEAFNVHGLSEEFLSTQPLFKDIADGFINFIKGSELLIHNAKFDINFLNKELDLADKGKIWDHITNAICTLDLSKRLYPKFAPGEIKGHKLDNLCLRFGVDTTEREEKGHGALLDSHLLADCFIKINEIHPAEDIEADLEQTNWTRPPIKRFTNIVLPAIVLSSKEEVQHQEFVSNMGAKEKVTALFNKVSNMKP